MNRVKDKVDELVAAILESAEYRQFQEAVNEVDSVPGLSDRIREYCWKNYELQNSGAPDLYDKMEAFEKENREFRRNSTVTRYLENELAMCRMMQRIDARLFGLLKLKI